MYPSERIFIRVWGAHYPLLRLTAYAEAGSVALVSIWSVLTPSIKLALMHRVTNYSDENHYH
jgi:hypothetical protein